MLRRCNTGYMDGYYSLPAGHVEKDETLLDAVIREAKEEIGITIKADDLKLVHTNNRTDTNPNRINFFFERNTWSGELINQEPNKCDDIKWVSLNILPDNIVPELAKALPCIILNKPYSEIHNNY